MEEYHHQNIRWMQAAQGMNAYQMQRLYAQQQAQQMGFVEQQQQFVSSPHGHTSPHSPLNNRVMNTSQAPGTVFMVQPQATKGEYAGNVTLTINGLPRNADVGLLHDLFAPYGRIHNAFIDQDEGKKVPSAYALKIAWLSMSKKLMHTQIPPLRSATRHGPCGLKYAEAAEIPTAYGEGCEACLSNARRTRPCALVSTY